MPQSIAEQAELPRKLGLLDATSIVAGTMIGAGIFLVPSLIARSVPSGPHILAIWALAGVASFCGALGYAELGAMFPRSGGQYVYLREAYGRLPAFLAGWAFLLIIQSGAIAAVATGFGIYLAYLFPKVSVPAAAAVLIAVLSAINYLGVRQGARVQVVFMAAKLAGIGVLISSAFSGLPPVPLQTLPHVPLPALGSALLAAFVAFEGWHVVAFVAGEVKAPKRNLPLALALGVSGVMIVYLLTNWAFLRVLTLPEIAASTRVAADTASRVWGPGGAALVTWIILLSSIGCANGSILTAPRVYFAQARDGLFFRQFAAIHPRFETPARSIVLQGVWACALTSTGSYEVIASYVIFISWAIHAATVSAVLVLRRTRPDLPRPYKMWGYTVTPLLFLAFSIWFTGNTLLERPGSSLAGCLILASGIPAYYFLRREPTA